MVNEFSIQGNRRRLLYLVFVPNCGHHGIIKFMQGRYVGPLCALPDPGNTGFGAFPSLALYSIHCTIRNCIGSERMVVRHYA